MAIVILESANNGIIKTIRDNNINGAGATLEFKHVYDFTNDDNHKKKIEFFYDLAEDLGIDIGNIYKANNLVMTVDWGNSYLPTREEIMKKIKSLRLSLKQLENKYIEINK